MDDPNEHLLPEAGAGAEAGPGTKAMAGAGPTEAETGAGNAGGSGTEAAAAPPTVASPASASTVELLAVPGTGQPVGDDVPDGCETGIKATLDSDDDLPLEDELDRYKKDDSPQNRLILTLFLNGSI